MAGSVVEVFRPACTSFSGQEEHTMHSEVERVTRRIIERSRKNREQYLQRLEEARGQGPYRRQLPCSNLAHDLAACAPECRRALMDDTVPNIAIISAYNDLVSAH
ncbi:MAG TPA: hypothetical protein ENK27_01875, partial [Desulfobulbus sp.]|nr:hypothetical protein [Desulfobulbus sp.]